MGRLRDFKNSFLEILWIVKSTVTTFWYWFPIIYMGYVFLQLWMMFYIHPLTLALLPVVLIIYGIRHENKRIRARWGLEKPKRFSATHGQGTSPEPVGEFEWKVERSVQQYEDMLKARKVKETETEED